MKIVIVGLGSVGQRHARNLRAILGDDLELYALRKKKRNIVIKEGMIAEEGDPEKFYSIKPLVDVQDVINIQPEAVFLTNPSSLHAEYAIPIAKQNIPLFIEKPLSNNLSDLKALQDSVDKGSLIYVGYQLRFHPAFEKIEDILRGQKLGNIIAAHLQFGEYLPNAHPYEDYRQGYAARKELGGGVLLCFIHELDAAVKLFGKPDSVYCVASHSSSLELDVEDCAYILAEHTSGVRRFPVQISLDFIQKKKQRIWNITCEKGSIQWDLVRNVLEIADDSKKETMVEEFATDRNFAFIEEVRHFLDCVHTKALPRVTFEDARASLEFAAAAKRSSELGKVIGISDSFEDQSS
ncbi:MAG: Gfo/Idh/MocA family oxidoreductase [Deltaproteobacteria bacterium]|nr:Gfo/Idh/MocA family oxidoreductase [Deltaproteobacteria bacterium]